MIKKRSMYSLMDPEAQKGIPGGLYPGEHTSGQESWVCAQSWQPTALKREQFSCSEFCKSKHLKSSSVRESSRLDDLNEDAISVWFMNKIALLSLPLVTMLGFNCAYVKLANYEAYGRRSEKRKANDDEKVVAEIMQRCFVPTFITTTCWEGFHFVGHEIRITEAMDCYGAVVWPSALVLCYFLETNVKQYNMVDKNVIEIGAGTGLVSIVASLLGAHVTATDLPELLGNLQYNLSRNTKMKCKHLPQVKELSWGVALDKNFPRSSNSFDYILAADVVYAHPFLEELLLTFEHLCRETTVILWVMKFRLEKENRFIDRFQELFDLEEISSFPSLNIKLFKATKKNRRNA